MATPYFTLATFRDLTRVRQAKLGIDSTAVQGDNLLQHELDRAAAYVQMVTGQPATDQDSDTIAPALDSTLTGDVLKPLISQAIQMRTEQIAFQAQNGYVDDASDDVIASLSVGSFSQTKTDPGRRGEQRTLNTWEALASLLWMLMTPDRYDFWLVALGGANALALAGPAWSYEDELWPPYLYGFAGYDRFPANYWDGSYGGALPFDVAPLDLEGLE